MIPSPGGGRNPAEKTELPQVTEKQQSEAISKLVAARRKIDEQLALMEPTEENVPASAGPEEPTKREPLSGQRAQRTEVPQFKMSDTKEGQKSPLWGEDKDWGRTSGWEKKPKEPLFQQQERDRENTELLRQRDERERDRVQEELQRQRRERERTEDPKAREQRRDEVVQQLLEEVDTLQKELRGGRPQKDSAFRIGNIVAKIPMLTEPTKNTEGRLVQLADYTRDFTKYIDATLYEDPAGCTEQFSQRSAGAHRAYIETKPRERNGLQESKVTIEMNLSKVQDRYFRSICPLVEDRLPRDVLRELEDFDDLQLFGFQRLLAIFMCIRRIFDVGSMADLDRIERVARNPDASEYGELRAWWTVARSAQKTGHVSWSQVARGLTKLVENLEEKKRFLPRIMRDVTSELTALGLTEFGAREEDIATFVRYLLGLMRDHKAPTRTRPAWQAHVARNDWDEAPGDDDQQCDPGNEWPDSWEAGTPVEGEPDDEELWEEFNAYRAAKGKPKGKGKGGGKGRGGDAPKGRPPPPKNTTTPKPPPKPPPDQSPEKKRAVKCFKCGGDHYLWDCPVDRERTAKGLCWVCGGQHLKRDCPEKDKVRAYLANINDDDDEERGDEIPPAPNE